MKSFSWHKPESSPSEVAGVVVDNATAVLEILDLQRNHWRKLHTTRFTAKEFELWIQGIPGCSACQRDFRRLIEHNPPRFAEWFRWTFDVHNLVNQKLGKPNLSWKQACELWGWDEPEDAIHTMPCQSNPPVKLNRKNTIVTALSPNRIDRQVLCIKTWLASGFKVIANQTDKEMESFPKVFHEISDLIEWRVNNDVESFYDFKTQKIRNLLAIENAILINSDCEMAGEYDWQSGGISTFFLRWNYKPGQEPREFEWGIDGAWLTREAWAALPEDFPYCIGQAMWDYAVPHIFKIKGIPFKIDHKAWLFHEEHQQNWTQAYWQKGVEWLEANGYHSPIHYSDTFRQTLDPDWYYDYNRGFWVKKEIQ